MGRILIAWELGGHLGHLGRFVGIAKRFRELGHEPFFACRDLRSAGIMLAPHDFPFLQAPVYRGAARGAPRPPRSYSEILLHHGYLNSRDLSGLIGGWRGLTDLIRPELVLSDYAPTALLALRGTGIPCASFGSGFFLPPSTEPLPPLEPWQHIPPERLRYSDALVLGVINEVLTGMGETRLDFLHEALSVDECFLTTVAEIDHYGARSKTHYWGPVIGPDAGSPPPWPESKGPRIFGYVKPRHGYLEAVVESLAEIECSAVVFSPREARLDTGKLSAANVRVVDKPLDVRRCAQESDLAITHAGHDTSATMLVFGTPILMLPLQVEQYVLSRRIHDLGAGLIVHPRDGEAGVRKGLHEMLSDESYRNAARFFSNKYAWVRGTGVRDAVVARCLALMDGGRSRNGG